MTKEQKRERQLGGAIASVHRKVAHALRRTTAVVVKEGLITEIGGVDVSGSLEVYCTQRWWWIRGDAKELKLSAVVRSSRYDRWSTRARYFRCNKAGELPIDRVVAALAVVAQDNKARVASRKKIQARDEREARIRAKLLRKYPALRTKGDDEQTVSLTTCGRLQLEVRDLSEAELTKVCAMLMPFIKPGAAA